MKVAVYSGRGSAEESVKRIVEILKDFEVIAFSEEVPVADVLVIPGGSAAEISLALGVENLHRIERMVREGTKYIGICAGAYLAMEGYWQDRTLTGELVLIDSYHPDIENWRRGSGKVFVSLIDHPITFGLEKCIEMWYENGPIFSEGDYETIGVFETDIGGGEVSLLGTPAIVCSEFGNGKVILFSPHPEFSGENGIKLLVNSVLGGIHLGDQESNRRGTR